MRNNSFVAFILTHGRPDKVYTYDTLKKCGYTGEIYIICDDEDKALPQYQAKFENVLVFSKKEIAKTFDEGDNFGDRRAIVYARNACFELAKKIGVEYFIELDDDYMDFEFRFDNNLRWKYRAIKNLDVIFDALVDFHRETPTLSIAMAQGGDFIGGIDATVFKDGIPLKRKCMNSFICSTSRPFQFVGRINEDVNTCTSAACRGVFFTLMQVMLRQLTTQNNSGGMTELYLDSGTYVKSFYSVMYHPSSVKVRLMGETSRRLHHNIIWNNTVPMILSEKHKK